MWHLIAGAAMSYMQSSMASAEKAKLMLENKRLAREARINAINNIDNDYYKNRANIEQTQLKNDFAIESAKLEANDNLKRSMAGSGISGTTIDEMDAQIASDTASAHVENKYDAKRSSDKLYADRKVSTQNAFNAEKSVPTFNAEAEQMNNLFAAGAGAASAWTSEDTAKAKGWFNDAISSNKVSQSLSIGDYAGANTGASYLYKG